jgi:hypothetical protein
MSTASATVVDASSRRPAGITFVSVFNAIGALITILFWSLAAMRLPALGSLPTAAEKAAVGTTYSFMIADILWALPLLIVASVGVWRLRFWGWTAAQMTNVLWWYSVTVVAARDLITGTVSPGTIAFLPFALVSFAACRTLWISRERFIH